MDQRTALEEENRYLRFRVATLEQLLKVQEQTVLEQSGRLETTITQLEQRGRELETFNELMIGREERVLELKQEVNELLEKMNLSARYGI